MQDAGYDKGVKQRKKSKQIEIAKKLKKMNISDIEKATGLKKRRN